MKKFVKHLINIEAESRIEKKGFLWIIPSKDGNNVFILQVNILAESGIEVKRFREYIIGYDSKQRWQKRIHSSN